VNTFDFENTRDDPYTLTSSQFYYFDEGILYDEIANPPLNTFPEKGNSFIWLLVLGISDGYATNDIQLFDKPTLVAAEVRYTSAHAIAFQIQRFLKNEEVNYNLLFRQPS
jgi:hypothetical protein